MDTRLSDRLNAWHKHISKVKDAELVYLSLEANEKSLFSRLFLASSGKNVAERESLAYSHQDWIDFKSGLAAAQVEFNRLRRELELLIAAYNAEYLTMKMDGDAVKRYPNSMT